MPRSAGPELALLLLGGFRSLVDDVSTELAHRGHAGVRPADEFALRAIDGGAVTASELSRRLSVTKQAAAQRITHLQELGYVDRAVDPDDARRRTLRVTARGHEMMDVGGVILDELRERWVAVVGRDQLDALQEQLAVLVGPRDDTTVDDVVQTE